jgi:branched-chain amino acid transport system permease protein
MTFPGRRGALLLLLLAMAMVLPPYLGTYYTRFATQIAIYGMAALSVDLLLGYTGLITFGQAALFGVGAYAAGMLTVYGVTSALVAWPLAIMVSMLFALAIGSLSLRTRGFQFIMVTLAFAQMVYYFAQSLRNWGGDDGFTVPQRNHLGFVSLADHTTFYYVVLVLLVLVIFIAARGRGRLPALPVQAGHLCHCRWHSGTRRRADGQPREIRQPRDAELAVVGRIARHGHPGFGQFADRADPGCRVLSGVP